MKRPLRALCCLAGLAVTATGQGSDSPPTMAPVATPTTNDTESPSMATTNDTESPSMAPTGAPFDSWEWTPAPTGSSTEAPTGSSTAAPTDGGSETLGSYSYNFDYSYSFDYEAPTPSPIWNSNASVEFVYFKQELEHSASNFCPAQLLEVCVKYSCSGSDLCEMFQDVSDYGCEDVAGAYFYLTPGMRVPMIDMWMPTFLRPSFKYTFHHGAVHPLHENTTIMVDMGLNATTYIFNTVVTFLSLDGFYDVTSNSTYGYHRPANATRGNATHPFSWGGYLNTTLGVQDAMSSYQSATSGFDSEEPLPDGSSFSSNSGLDFSTSSWSWSSSSGSDAAGKVDFEGYTDALTVKLSERLNGTFVCEWDGSSNPSTYVPTPAPTWTRSSSTSFHPSWE